MYVCLLVRVKIVGDYKIFESFSNHSQGWFFLQLKKAPLRALNKLMFNNVLNQNLNVDFTRPPNLLAPAV